MSSKFIVTVTKGKSSEVSHFSSESEAHQFAVDSRLSKGVTCVSLFSQTGQFEVGPPVVSFVASGFETTPASPGRKKHKPTKPKRKAASSATPIEVPTVAAPAAAPAKKKARRKAPMTCIAEGCANKSKGPRFRYLCDAHKGSSDAQIAKWKGK